LSASRKTERLVVRLTGEELSRFGEICAHRGIALAEGVRRLIREAAQFGPTLDGASRDEVRAMTAELKAIGRNLNQFVRAMNTGLAPDVGSLRAQIAVIQDTFQTYDRMFGALCAPRRGRAIAALEKPAAGS
jgi:hypothetical protein